MATYNGANITSGAVKAIHAGVNAAVGSVSPGATVASGDQLNVLRLPPGAEVIDVKVKVTGVVPGAISVHDSEGNEYASTATPAAGVYVQGTGSGYGTRLTGSANLFVRPSNLSGALAGNESAVYSVVVEYLSEQDGD